MGANQIFSNPAAEKRIPPVGQPLAAEIRVQGVNLRLVYGNPKFYPEVFVGFGNFSDVSFKITR